jgi:hypothetical protein
MKTIWIAGYMSAQEFITNPESFNLYMVEPKPGEQVAFSQTNSQQGLCFSCRGMSFYSQGFPIHAG